MPFVSTWVQPSLFGEIRVAHLCSLLVLYFLSLFCALCLMLSLLLDFPFLIAPSGFSNVYLQAVNHIGKNPVVLIWAYRSI
jgi:hypothetical protein